jgi:hypothetical protein
MATIGDFGLAWFTIWYVNGIITTEAYIGTKSLIAAIGVAAFEFFFHRYLLKNQANEHNHLGSSTLQYQTEASEELNPYQSTTRNKTKE